MRKMPLNIYLFDAAEISEANCPKPSSSVSEFTLAHVELSIQSGSPEEAGALLELALGVNCELELSIDCPPRSKKSTWTGSIVFSKGEV